MWPALFMCWSVANTYAQPTYTAVAQLGAPGRVVLTELTADGQGGFYVAGDYRDALVWGDSSLAAPVGIGAFAARVGADLRPRWIIADPGTNTDGFAAAATGPDGSVWWAGSFFGNARLGDSLLVTPNNQKGLFLLQTDDGGTVLQTRLLTGPATKTITDLLVDETGAVYVTGSFADTLVLQQTLLTTDDGADRLGYVAKYSATGQLLFARRIGDSGTVDPRGLAQTGDGRVVLVGDLEGTIGWGGASIKTIGANVDVFVAALTTDGAPQWIRKAGGEQTDRVYRVVADAANHLYLAGRMTAVFGIGNGLTVQTPNFEPNAYLASYTSDGMPRWVRTYGNEQPETATDLVLRNDRLWLTGIFRENTELDGISLSAPAGSQAAGYVLQTDLEGRALRALATTGSDWVIQRRLAVDATERVTVAGRFDQQLTLGDATLTAVGDYDGYLATFDPALTPTVQLPAPRVTVFPNPARDSIGWRSETPVREALLYDWNGRLWRRQVNVTALETTGLPRGAWRLELKFADARSYQTTVILQ